MAATYRPWAATAARPSSRWRKENYTNAFPTVQLRYTIQPQLIARATYSTGIARPGFNQNSVATSVDLTQNPVTITQGNPNLKPTTGDNYDIDLEYYMA